MTKIETMQNQRDAAFAAIADAEAVALEAVAARDELLAARARGFVLVARAPHAVDEDDFLADLFAAADDHELDREQTVGRLDAAIVAAEAAVEAAVAAVYAARGAAWRLEDALTAARRVASRKAAAAERKAEAAARAARWAARA